LWQCIKFKTFSSIFLNRFEALNLSLIQKMQNQRKEEPPMAEQSTPAEARVESPAPAAAIQSAPTASGVTKKKKPKKKK
jgi:signal recognition particle subunit SRP9